MSRQTTPALQTPHPRGNAAAPREIKFPISMQPAYGLRAVAGVGLLLWTLSIGACGGQPPAPSTGDQQDNTSEAADQPEDYVPDPNVYVWPTEPSSLVEQATAEGDTISYPVDQLIVLMNEGADQDAAESLARTVGGSIVGQVPEIDFYQIRVSSVTPEELEVLIARAEADPNVSFVGYNAINTLDQTCPALNDNADILTMDKCAFSETEYYQAITMFEFFRPHLQLHPVTVGIVDTGLDMDTGEFTDAIIIYLNDISASPVDRDSGRHGTGVSGMIAADDDGNGVNGVASRFVYERLRLVVGAQDGTLASCLTYASMCAGAGANIINLSIGWEGTHPRFAVIREGWRRLMARRSNTLFVAAAGNESLTLDGRNYAPGGIGGLPNLITVGATARCEPTRLAGFSNRGSPVDISAPGEAVPAVSTGGLYLPISGTSIATPMVTALAAILKSIQPGLSPAQLKGYITQYSHPIPDVITHGRLVYTSPLMQLLIDMHPGDPLTGWLDPYGLGTLGASGLVMSRLCPAHVAYSVEGYGSHDVYESEGYRPAGLIGSASHPPVASVNGADVTSTFTVGSSTLSEFALGSYLLVAEAEGDTFVATFFDRESLDSGMSISGTIEFETCRIDQRDPFDGVNPWIVNIGGAFNGVFEIAHFDGRDPTFHEFHGHFNVPAIVGVTDDEELFAYLEASCEGGIPAP